MKKRFPQTNPTAPHKHAGNPPPVSPVALMPMVLLLALTAATCRREASSNNSAELTVTSDPPGAMVFLNNRYLGLTPVSAQNLRSGEYLLRLEKYDFVTVRKRVKVKGTRSELHVALRRVPKASLLVKSEPPGANIYIDGEPKDKSPRLIEGLTPGPHEIRLEKKFYFPWVGQVEVEASKRSVIEPTLKSKTVAYYEDMIKRSPKNLHNYIELAKHYVLQQNVEKASKVFVDALEVSTKYGVARDGLDRLYQEIGKVYTAQYDYGDEEVQRKFREKIEEILESFLEKHPQSRRCYALLAGFYKTTDRIDKALAFFERASKTLPMNEDIQATLCELYLRKGNVEKALELAKKAKKRWRQNARIRYVKGVAEMRLGLVNEAKVSLKTALLYCEENERGRHLEEKVRNALRELDKGTAGK